MVGWHHSFNGHELQQTLGDGEGQVGRCAAVHGVTKSQTGDLATEQQQPQIYSCPKSEGKSNQVLRFKH